jgi:hypothetical protein
MGLEPTKRVKSWSLCRKQHYPLSTALPHFSQAPTMWRFCLCTLEDTHRDQVKRLSRGGVNTIGKEHFTYLYKPAGDRAINARNIRAGWAAAGLFLFNPDKVLREMPKPAAEHISPGVDIAATCSEKEIP